MMRKKAYARQLALMTIIAGMISFAVGIRASGNAAGIDIPERPDVITIDAMTAFGPIERPPVEFLHDRHTQAVEKAGKDCLACHPPDEASGRLSLRYMRFQETDRQAVMETYHAGCITCHNEQLSAGKAGGPVECAGCHANAAKTLSNRQPFGMDNSLHFRHIKSTRGGCGACHHVYNAETKKLVYARRKESTCRYCHTDRAEDNRMTMRKASHTACIGCHRSLAVQDKTSGPVTCAGCHDPEQQAGIEKLAKAPRLRTGQPDTLFIRTRVPESTRAESSRMNQVPFDHKAHETYNDTCRVCHHAGLTGCADCHTVPGRKKGARVNLEQAMHRSGPSASCIGCHERKQTENACIGCHGFMAESRQMPRTYCAACHMAPPAGSAAAEAEPPPRATAAELLTARTPAGTYDLAHVPERVTIASLSKTYEPVELPHGKIVSALKKGIGESRLADHFHTEQGTLCRGCHHNSPAAETPPRCVSCHGEPFQEDTLFRPGLMAAYHQQCMGCHDRMGIEAPASRDCTGCHEEKR